MKAVIENVDMSREGARIEIVDEPKMPDAVDMKMSPVEAAAYVDFQLAAKHLLKSKTDFEAASQWFQKALAKLSDAASAPK